MTQLNFQTRKWSEEDKILMEDETVQEIAKKYGKTPAQILIRHGVERGLILIPKSVTPSRIESNAQIFDFRKS